MNTILYRDKTLIRTLSSPIYQNENRADSLKFLISTNTLSEFNTEDLTCMICVTLPDGQSGKIAFLSLKKDSHYENYLVDYIPITKALTKLSGTLSLSLVFSYEDSNQFFHYLPTNSISITVLESKSSDAFIDPDETANPLVEMAQKITELENSKVANIDTDEHAVHFYADTAKTILIGSINLPEDVLWTTMEDMK